MATPTPGPDQGPDPLPAPPAAAPPAPAPPAAAPPAHGPALPREHPYRRTFPATTDQVGAARRFIAGLLAGNRAAADATLLVSEIAANSVLHSRSARPGGTFTVSFRRSGPAIRIEITDQGGHWRLSRPHDDETGRGLDVVLALSDRRGILAHSSGECAVWVEFDPR